MIGELWDWLWSFLKANQFASGGVLIGMIGGVAVALRSVPGRIFRGLRRLLIVEVEVLDTDEAFQWLSLWLSRHHRPSRGRNLQVMTATRQSFLGPSVPQPVYSGQATKHDEKLPPIRLVPGIGRHLVWRSGWPILLHHYRDEGGGPGGDLMKMLIRPERFVLHGLVFSRKAMVKLLQAAREEAMPPPDRLRLFLGNYAAWTPLGEIDGRPLDTVILPEGVTDNLIRDIEQFRGRRDWYQHRGIPWRRGYLLSGPPGNGKTSLIRAVATHLGMHLGIVNLASTEASDTYLLELFTRAQSDMVVVIEDVDCLYDQRTRSKEVGSKISFSGLLNAIDGLASSNGCRLPSQQRH